MDVDRRAVLRGGLAAGAAVFFPPRHASGAPAVRDPRHTTLESTVLRGAELPGRGGYRLLVHGPGEPHLLRTDLGANTTARRLSQRLPFATFVQFTDTHVLDAQSPARVEFLDRYTDGPSSFTPFDSSWRPQEPFTLHLADALVRATTLVRRGPVFGRPYEFTMCTGDNIDNAQFNELRWFIDLFDGKNVRPDSGDLAKWEGVCDGEPTSYDAHYWHPDGTPAGKVDDQARRYYGFPVIPGALDAARRPFRATALPGPWYVTFGNHDPLMQGNAAPNPVFSGIATGTAKVVGLPAGISPSDFQEGLQRQDPAVLQALATAPARQVTADVNRRPLTRPEWMAEFFRTSSRPVGHGFSQANVATTKGYYAFDHGRYLRCVVMDTVNPGGYADGSLDATQFAWLQNEFKTYSKSGGGVDKLIVLFSHHNSVTMENPVLAPGETAPRIFANQLVGEILKWPNVVLWVNGHSHINRIYAHPLPGGGGFWELNTAAHIDWPHQSRIFELADNLDGTLSIFSTVYDADAPLSYAGRLDSPRSLAALARELGANDWQARNPVSSPNEGGRRGTREERNVELVVRAPFQLNLAAPPRAVAAPERRSEPVIADTGLPDWLPTGAALTVAAAGLAAAARRSKSGEAEDIGL